MPNPTTPEPTDPADRPGCAECGKPSTAGPDADGFCYCQDCLGKSRICPKCRELNEPGDDVCWSCEASLKEG